MRNVGKREQKPVQASEEPSKKLIEKRAENASKKQVNKQLKNLARSERITKQKLSEISSKKLRSEEEASKKSAKNEREANQESSKKRVKNRAKN